MNYKLQFLQLLFTNTYNYFGNFVQFHGKKLPESKHFLSTLKDEHVYNKTYEYIKSLEVI